MQKPHNPYKRGTTIWSLFEGDWEDLTATQIAEVLDCPRRTIDTCLRQIKKDTGYVVPRTLGRRGRRSEI